MYLYSLLRNPEGLSLFMLKQEFVEGMIWDLQKDNNAEVNMVLCLSTNSKECAAVQVSWLFALFKNLYTLGSEVVTPTLPHCHDRADQAI